MFTPIEANDKLYQKVLRQLEELIKKGELNAGDKLPPERQLAECLGVSRPALKQALSSLEALGVIECRQGDGNYVQPLNKKLFNPVVLSFYEERGTMDDILEVRYILEVQVVKIVAQKASPEQIQLLYEIAEKMKGSHPLESRIALNNDFHSTLVHFSGNPLLTAFYDSILDLVALQIHNTDGENFYLSHKKIVDGIQNRNPILASRMMADHFTAKFPNYQYYTSLE